jgi:hypothetical protein
MNRVTIVSNNLRSVGYDAQHQVLEIQFHAGGIYQYHEVPVKVYNELMTASSKGSYFERNIKHKYQERRMLIV